MANDINTTSLDLPPALASILGMQTPPVQQAPMVGMNIPSFQQGGLIGGYTAGEILPNPVRAVKYAADAAVNLPRAISAMQKRRETGPSPYNPGEFGYTASESSVGNDPFGMGPSGFIQYGHKQEAMDRMGASDLGMRYQGYLDNMVNPSTGGGIARDVRLGDQSLNMELPSFQEGGMIGEGGMPIPPGAVPGMPMAGVSPQMDMETPMDPQMMQMQINQVASRHPEAMAEIRNAITEELQSGDLTQQELNMIVQLAQLAANNPEMYPYVKQFAMQQGIAAAGDLPEQYDQSLVMVLLLAARAVQQDLGGAPAQAGQPPGSAAPVIPSMQKGGMLPASGKSEPIIIEAHTGEYVIPKHVVDMKGKEFFDSLVEKYKDRK
jgi:hypothetical protein